MRTRKLRGERLWVLVAFPAVIVFPGCQRDVRLSGRKVHDVTVRTVTHFGMTLDKNASPEQVTYVLLRAIHDDFLAKTRKQREEALDFQFDVCAADEIKARTPAALSPVNTLYRVVYHWTPTVSYYVDDIETEWGKAKARLVSTAPQPSKFSKTGAQVCKVSIELHDPSGDSKADVVFVVGLIQDQGYWRVMGLAFDPRRRSLKVSSATTHGVLHGADVSGR